MYLLYEPQFSVSPLPLCMPDMPPLLPCLSCRFKMLMLHIALIGS